MTQPPTTLTGTLQALSKQAREFARLFPVEYFRSPSPKDMPLGGPELHVQADASVVRVRFTVPVNDALHNEDAARAVARYLDLHEVPHGYSFHRVVRHRGSRSTQVRILEDRVEVSETFITTAW
jgi:hypothetical protein